MKTAGAITIDVTVAHLLIWLPAQICQFTNFKGLSADSFSIGNVWNPASFKLLGASKHFFMNVSSILRALRKYKRQYKNFCSALFITEVINDLRLAG